MLHTVDGNQKSGDQTCWYGESTILDIRFYTSQVVVWDFWTIDSSTSVAGSFFIGFCWRLVEQSLVTSLHFSGATQRKYSNKGGPLPLIK